MSFQFRVEKVWAGPEKRFFHLIGILDSGTVIPPVVANISGRPGATVRIDSIALGGGKTIANELTLVASQLTIDPNNLEGCILSDART